MEQIIIGQNIIFILAKYRQLYHCLSTIIGEELAVDVIIIYQLLNESDVLVIVIIRRIFLLVVRQAVV